MFHYFKRGEEIIIVLITGFPNITKTISNTYIADCQESLHNVKQLKHQFPNYLKCGELISDVFVFTIQQYHIQIHFSFDLQQTYWM